MPRFKKKFIKRRKVYRKRARKMPLPLGGVSRSKTVKLRYVQTFNLDPGTGSYAQQTFRATSIYDPDQSGGGHQPCNFDVWAQQYSRYTVLGSKLRVQPVYASTTISTPGVLSVCLSNDGKQSGSVHGLGGIDAILEQPYTRFATATIGFFSAKVPVITKTYSAKKFFGTKFINGVEPYSSDVTTDPAENAFYEILYESADNSNDPGAMTFRATIDYIVRFSEPGRQELS